VIVGRRRSGPAQADNIATVDEQVVSDESRSSFTGATVTLLKHQTGVSTTVSGFAARVALPDELAADLRVGRRRPVPERQKPDLFHPHILSLEWNTHVPGLASVSQLKVVVIDVGRWRLASRRISRSTIPLFQKHVERGL
jgi:hypothetical protein